MKQLIFLIIAVFGISLLPNQTTFAQDGRITVIVTDADGNPLKGATINIGEGNATSFSDEDGKFTIQVKERTAVLIEAEGFESKLVIAFPPPWGIKSVVLEKAPYRMGEKEQVSIPFGTLKNRQLTGAATDLKPEEILRYDSQDDYSGAIGGRVPGMFPSYSLRGKGNPLIVVDGIPRTTYDINLQQIDQITVLKDLSSALIYGSQARNGVIMITTKRGELLKRKLRLTAQNGINTPISYPNYLNASDYMTYHNQARLNDGLTPLYTDEQINKTASGMYPTRYPDEGYYNSTYLNDAFTTYKIVGEAGGGNEVAQYYLNLDWNRENSLYKLGEGGSAKTDNFSIRGNVDYNLNENLHIRFDGAFGLLLIKEPRFSGNDFWSLASTLKPNYSPVLIPTSMTEDDVLIESAQLIDNQYILGGTSEFRNNIYGEFTKNGSRNIIARLVRMNLGLDYDLKSITPGLSASGYLSFDITNLYEDNLLNSYAVYTPVFLNDTVISTATKVGLDEKKTDKTVQGVYFDNRVGAYGALNYNKVFSTDHEIKASAIAYFDQVRAEGQIQPLKHLHFGIRANYGYKNKYFAELTGVMAGSVKLFESDRYAFSPGIGASWVISEESFMSSNSLINYLKLHANWAVNHSDENIGYNQYMPRYFTEGNSWFYNSRTNSNNSRSFFEGNSSLGWEKITEFNFGFDMEMLKGKIGLEGAYFYTLASDMVTTRSFYLPVYVSLSAFENYEKGNYQGVEMGLSYRESFGDLKLTVGTNLVYSVPKAITVDELNRTPEMSYLNASGKPIDAMFGLVALGLFRDSTEITSHPYQTFGIVKPGDIKYKDLNGDNLIDENDRMMIGNASSRIGYAINLNLKYKAFEFFAQGNGNNGGESYYNNEYYWVYGTRKYSEVVLNSWTPATAGTATYPRLSTTQSGNNFRNSTYWIESRNYFRLQTVQLTYTLSPKSGILAEARFFIRGNNLATFSKTKDKMDLAIGRMPNLRQFSAGLVGTF
jgi:TonB-linked SusC/RagA family outer membrane protein